MYYVHVEDDAGGCDDDLGLRASGKCGAFTWEDTGLCVLTVGCDEVVEPPEQDCENCVGGHAVCPIDE